MKLIFRHCSEEGIISTIPFKYESKEKFLFDFYESKLDIMFGIQLTEWDNKQNIERCIFTLEEWFDHYEESVDYENSDAII